MKNISRALSLILALTLALAILIVPASAASVPFSSSRPCKMYCRADSGRIQVFLDDALTKTSDSVEYIDAATDECELLNYNSTYNSLTVKYPVGNGNYKIRKCGADVFFGSGKFSTAKTVTVTSQLNGYRRPTGSTTYGWADPGDTITVLASEGSNRTLVIWPIDNGNAFRGSWVNTDDLNRVTTAAAKSATNTTQSGNSISYNKFVEMVEPFLRDRNHAPGATWDANRTPDWSGWTSYGCCSFCCDYAKKVFAKEDLWEGKKFHNAKEIRYGDVLEFENSPHYVVVLNNNNGDLLTIEGNWGGKVVAGHFYSVRADGVVLRNGTPFRTLEAGYHFT